MFELHNPKILYISNHYLSNNSIIIRNISTQLKSIWFFFNWICIFVCSEVKHILLSILRLLGQDINLFFLLTVNTCLILFQLNFTILLIFDFCVSFWAFFNIFLLISLYFYISSVFTLLSNFSCNFFYNVFNFLKNLYSNFLVWQNWSYNNFLSTPLTDLDLIVTTDCEDLLVFFGDMIEFTEQDVSLLFDILLGGSHNTVFSSSIILLDCFLLHLLKHQTFSIILAKFF